MNVSPNWGLMQPVDIGSMFNQGVEQGRARRAQDDWRTAMQDYARNPTDPAVHDRLVQLDPERGIVLRDQALRTQAQSVEAKRGQWFNDAAGRYTGAMRGNINALMPFASPQTAAPQRNALAPALPPIAGPASAPQGVPGGDVAAPKGSAPAAPVDPEAAFREMFAIDPVRAMEIESQSRDALLDRLEQTDAAYEFAIRRIANVQDEAGYQAAVADMERIFSPLGVDLRANVPASFPGPDGMQSLLMTALSAREQIAALDRRDRTSAYIDNIEADNERADRNTNSLIADRETRTGISARREARIAAGGGGRGGGGRGGRGRGRRGRGREVTAVNPETGETRVLRNGQWVPVQ